MSCCPGADPAAGAPNRPDEVTMVTQTGVKKLSRPAPVSFYAQAMRLRCVIGFDGKEAA